MSFIIYNYLIKVYYSKESNNEIQNRIRQYWKNKKVPGDKYWGASTERSNKYFNIGDF